MTHRDALSYTRHLFWDLSGHIEKSVTCVTCVTGAFHSLQLFIFRTGRSKSRRITSKIFEAT